MRTLAVAACVFVPFAIAAHQPTLTLDAPATWRPQPTASSMRVVQYQLPRETGDGEDGELVVYYFGGQGGTVQANLDRWLAQIVQPDGRPSKAVATTEQRTINGLTMTVLDVSGRYVAEVVPGSPEKLDKPGFRMKAVVIETPAGPYFVKLTGPARTVARWEQAFTTYLNSARFR